MYLLDTDVISAARRSDRSPSVAAWLLGKPEDTLLLSSITLGEIECGIWLRDQRNPRFATDLRAWLNRATLVFLTGSWSLGQRTPGSGVA